MQHTTNWNDSFIRLTQRIQSAVIMMRKWKFHTTNEFFLITSSLFLFLPTYYFPTTFNNNDVPITQTQPTTYSWFSFIRRSLLYTVESNVIQFTLTNTPCGDFPNQM